MHTSSIHTYMNMYIHGYNFQTRLLAYFKASAILNAINKTANKGKTPTTTRSTQCTGIIRELMRYVCKYRFSGIIRDVLHYCPNKNLILKNSARKNSVQRRQTAPTKSTSLPYVLADARCDVFQLDVRLWIHSCGSRICEIRSSLEFVRSP